MSSGSLENKSISTLRPLSAKDLFYSISSKPQVHGSLLSEHGGRLIPSSLTSWVFCLEHKFKTEHSTLIQQAVPGFHNLGYPSQANAIYYMEERQKLSV